VSRLFWELVCKKRTLIKNFIHKLWRKWYTLEVVGENMSKGDFTWVTLCPRLTNSSPIILKKSTLFIIGVLWMFSVYFGECQYLHKVYLFYNKKRIWFETNIVMDHFWTQKPMHLFLMNSFNENKIKMLHLLWYKKEGNRE